MALQACHNCGRMISDRAAACPGCGTAQVNRGIAQSILAPLPSATSSAPSSPSALAALPLPTADQSDVKPGLDGHAPAMVPYRAHSSASEPERFESTRDGTLGDSINTARGEAQSEARGIVRRYISVLSGSAIVIMLGVFIVGWWLWNHPAVVIDNDLVIPLVIRIDGKLERIAAGRMTTVRLDGRPTAGLTWTAAQPVNERPRSVGGEAIAGTAPVALPMNPLATGLIHVTARDGAYALFAPLITNTSGSTLRLRVNVELAGSDEAAAERDCGCVIEPGATRRFIGYYRLFRNSNVRVFTPTGDSAIFSNIGPYVDKMSGRISLTFSAEDFRRGGMR
jgi:hypothetical protein